MKLKKLDIIGFKSFYEKASINFPPGICADTSRNQGSGRVRGPKKDSILFKVFSGR